MTKRIDSLDLVRGLVMVLMAIDHVRCYAGQPAGGPTADIFFTRWVTHFCAPVFVFLAGTGAFLHGRALGDMSKLSRYLVTRGLLLMLLELTVVRFSWTFNVNYRQFTLFGVIWMLGCCMVLLAALVRLSPKTLGIIGVLIIVLQQAFAALRFVVPQSVAGSFGWLIEFVYPIGLETPGGVNILYTIVPWIGVMAAGYGFGAVVVRAPVERHRFYRRVGFAATALFLVFVGVALAFMPTEEGTPKIFLALNPPKDPASQPFLLMTLGPTIALVPVLEGARGALARWITVFGRVPFFFYLLHIPLIHALALVVSRLRLGEVSPWLFANHPMGNPPAPEGYVWSLGLLYVVWAAVIVLLYVPCRWFAGLKARRKDWWLSYL
jgi:uncharacterized membrane protein